MLIFGVAIQYWQIILVKYAAVVLSFVENKAVVTGYDGKLGKKQV
jgi:hypothetical protein